MKQAFTGATVFDGARLQGRVIGTWVDGTRIWGDA